MSLPAARLAAFATRRPKLVLVITLVLVALALWRAPAIEMRTSNLDLIDQDLPEVEHFLSFARAFGTPNALVVVLEGGDELARQAAVRELAPKLRALPEVRVVLDRPPYADEVLAENGLDPYLANDDHSLYFLFVQPRDERSSTAALAPFVKDVRNAIQTSALEEVRAGLTGIPTYALDDQEIIQNDITRLSLISLILILALFTLGFPSFSGPLTACLTLLASLAVCLGFISLYPGHLTLLSAMFASMLFGLGIDYGIHIVHHVEVLRSGGSSKAEAITRAYEDLQNPLNTAVLTTAAVFYALMFSGFKGFAELGLIAGTSLLICYLAMVTLLPALWMLLPGRAVRVRSHDGTGTLLFWLQHRWTGPLILLLTVALVVVGWPHFDNNYLNLQPVNSEAAQLERRMREHSDYSPYFAAFIAPNRDAAIRLGDRLRMEASVSDVRSLADLDEEGTDQAHQAPSEFRDVFIDAQGRYAVYAYPSIDIWDEQANRQFIQAMRAIDPQSTGMPFLADFMIARAKRALEITALLSIGLLLVITYLGFRNLRDTLISVAIPIGSMIWLGGCLKLLGVPFTPLNVMAIPIVLGIAVDDAVHITHRFRANDGDLRATLIKAGHGVVLTSATTLAAFGAVIFTSHRGLRGFSLALSIGVAAALVLAVLLLPMLLKIFQGAKTKSLEP